jgi:hypothetical protein
MEGDVDDTKPATHQHQEDLVLRHPAEAGDQAGVTHEWDPGSVDRGFVVWAAYDCLRVARSREGEGGFDVGHCGPSSPSIDATGNECAMRQRIN